MTASASSGATPSANHVWYLTAWVASAASNAPSTRTLAGIRWPRPHAKQTVPSVPISRSTNGSWSGANDAGCHSAIVGEGRVARTRA